MSLATRAPPATGSEPPSQKSFCTSTTISARFMDWRLLNRGRVCQRRPTRVAAPVSKTVLMTGSPRES